MPGEIDRPRAGGHARLRGGRHRRDLAVLDDDRLVFERRRPRAVDDADVRQRDARLGHTHNGWRPGDSER